MITAHTDRQADGHTHTHRQTQASTIPGGQNWPRVKIAKHMDTHSWIIDIYIGIYNTHDHSYTLVDIKTSNRDTHNSIIDISD